MVSMCFTLYIITRARRFYCVEGVDVPDYPGIPVFPGIPDILVFPDVPDIPAFSGFPGIFRFSRIIRSFRERPDFPRDYSMVMVVENLFSVRL